MLGLMCEAASLHRLYVHVGVGSTGHESIKNLEELR